MKELSHFYVLIIYFHYGILSLFQQKKQIHWKLEEKP